MMVDASIPENEAAFRGRLYALLAQAFLSEPDAALIDYFRSPEVLAVLAELSLCLEDEFLNREQGPLAEELAEEYARLFLVPPDHLPPYQSCYVGGRNDPEEHFEPALQGKAAQEVEAFYREHALILTGESRCLPDHLGVQLEALRLLCELEAAAEGRGDASSVAHYRGIAGRFLAEHLQRWVPAYCERVAQRTVSPFYRVVAQLTRFFIESELEELISGGLEKEEVIQ